jgi:two-component system, OmpR family, response regulator
MSRQKTTILHVEDEPGLQQLVRVTLEGLGGYAVRTAGDGHQAMAIARDPAPQLVLLDMNLPGMNGIATVRALRQMPGLAEVPVIFLTAIEDPAVEAELYALGARDVLRKPFRPRLLLESIASALGARRHPSNEGSRPF